MRLSSLAITKLTNTPTKVVAQDTITDRGSMMRKNGRPKPVLKLKKERDALVEGSISQLTSKNQS